MRAQATESAAELPRPIEIGKLLLTATLTFGRPLAEAARAKASVSNLRPRPCT
jgi:hypothetical protein